MTFTKIVALGAVLAMNANADEDPYSREGRDLSMLVFANAPALSTPQTNLMLALDPAEQFKYANRITPLGQRQQFLIGSELRTRYVNECSLLSADYIISQAYLQAPFQGTGILTMQALMLGLYPSTDANDLTEWQQ